GVYSNYDIDLFQSLIRAVADLTGVDPNGEQKASHRVISDHLRATAFLIADGVLPSNEGRGYVLRRILRRAVRHGKLLGFEKPFLSPLVMEVVSLMGNVYPELSNRKEHIVNVVKAEEERFYETLAAGTERLLEKID